MNGEPTSPVFRPEIFEVESIEQAMRITVTPELGTTTEERWEKETRYHIQDIGRFLPLRPESCVLDYGCGVGRIARELIGAYGCRVVGVDASKAMRLLSPEYVLSERFTVWSPEVLDKMIAKGFQADFAISLWVIQHAYDAEQVIRRIAGVLAAGALFYSVNGRTRCVPTNLGWIDDGFDLRAGLCRSFHEVEIHSLPVDVTTPTLAYHSMIQILRKP